MVYSRGRRGIPTASKLFLSESENLLPAENFNVAIGFPRYARDKSRLLRREIPQVCNRFRVQPLKNRHQQIHHMIEVAPVHDSVM